MFYSHEILTSRQHGVATIWLVATLGSKSNLKKITRKAILEVDVPKACDTITDPTAPMALRLQGSLLCGAARVYSQQCGYVLADSQTFVDKLKTSRRQMNEVGIDPDVGMTRPEQLNLSDDPAFIPELDMNFDLSIFDIRSETQRAPSVLSQDLLDSHLSNLSTDDAEEPRLIIPSIDTPADFGGFDFNLGVAASSAAGSRHQPGLSDLDESAIIHNPDFEIDDEGNIHEIQPAIDKTRASTVAYGELEPSETGLSARVRAEHEAGIGNNETEKIMVFDDAPFIFGDEDLSFPPSLPFAPQQIERNIDEVGKRFSSSPSVHPTEQPTASISVEAPQRREPAVKQLVADQRAELSSKQLTNWDENYLLNMEVATRAKNQNKSMSQAKKNAAFWIVAQGIGGVEVNFGADLLPHPLAVFSGQELLDALTGRGSSPSRSKRSRSLSQEARQGQNDEPARRVRARTDEEENIPRGDGDAVIGLAEDDGINFPGDDFIIESEVGRNAPPSLKDHSSAMPWNASVSRAGSIRPVGSAGRGISSSVGGFELGPPSVLAQRGSRLISASPLLGKGAPLPDLSGDDMELDDLPVSSAAELDDFELYGPSAAVDTQTAAQSQWISATLENEAQNFLGFLDAQIRDQNDRENKDGKSITLDELLPPVSNSNVVAAQAFLHVLALTTKGLIKVNQEEAFGDIHMEVIDQRDAN